MKRYLKNSLLLLVIIFLVPMFGAERSWNLQRNEKDIQVFVSETAGSAIKSFRGVITVDSSMDAVLGVISDISSYPRWMHDCRSAKTIKIIGKNETYHHIISNMPWPVIDRDSVVRSVMTEHPAIEQVTIRFAAKPELIKKLPNTVRIRKLQGYWELTSLQDNTLRVVYQVSLDPGGNIPVWMINSMGTDLPFYTLDKLRQIAKEAKYN